MVYLSHTFLITHLSVTWIKTCSHFDPLSPGQQPLFSPYLARHTFPASSSCQHQPATAAWRLPRPRAPRRLLGAMVKQRTPCGSHWCPWLSESHEATQRGPGRWNPDCGFASQPGNPGPGNSTSLVASLPLSPRETALCPRPIYKDKLKTQPRRGADRLPPGPPSLWLHPSLPAGLTSGQQRPGLNPGPV